MEMAAQLARSERIERQLAELPNTLVAGGLVKVPLPGKKVERDAQGAPGRGLEVPDPPEWVGVPLLELVWSCSLPLRLCT